MLIVPYFCALVLSITKCRMPVGILLTPVQASSEGSEAQNLEQTTRGCRKEYSLRHPLEETT